MLGVGGVEGKKRARGGGKGIMLVVVGGGEIEGPSSSLFSSDERQNFQLRVCIR